MNSTSTPAPAGVPAVVTRKQIAALLSVSEQHVDNLVRRWNLPRIEVGRRVRYYAADVFAALNNKEGAAR